jgi:hypothetical protein
LWRSFFGAVEGAGRFEISFPLPHSDSSRERLMTLKFSRNGISDLSAMVSEQTNCPKQSSENPNDPTARQTNAN